MKALLFLVPLLLASSAFAAHPLVTDDTGTQGVKGNQIEFSTDWTQNAGGKTRVAELTYTRGLTDDLDIALTIPGIYGAPRQQPTGFNDLSIGAKWRFLDTDQFSLGIKPEWTPATANSARGLGNGKDSFSLALIAQISLNDLTILINQSYAHNRFKNDGTRLENRTRINQTSTAVLYAIKDSVSLVADIGQRDSDASDHTAKTRFGILGIIWSIHESLDLDAGVQRTQTPDETENQWGIGITWRFK